MRISQMAATSASLYLNKATERMSKSSQRLSSGKRILSAADDPSGLARVQGMKATLAQYTQGLANLQDAKSYVSTKDGALSQITDLAQKISESYVQLADLSGDAATAVQNTIDSYAAEIDSIVENSTYNGSNLFSATATTFNTGAGSLSVAATTIADGSGSTLDFSDATATATSLASISGERAAMGAYENSIDARIEVNSIASENITAAISRIEDIDIETETIEYNKQKILQQAAQSVISSQNQAMGSILNLFV